jgi:hypothetical protein
MPEIGATLREARMRAKIDVSEVEAETKIRAKYLRALENEEWGLLPGSTFVKTFLRTYAEYLGLDAKLLLEEYKVRFESVSAAELNPITPNLGARSRPIRPRGPSRATVIGAVVVALVGMLFLLGKAFPEDDGDGDRAADPNDSPPPARTTPRRPARSPSAAPTKRPRLVRLQVVPTASVWVCLEDAGGRRLIAGTQIEPDDARRRFRSRRFRITLGNGQVRLRVNGRTFDVPDRPEPVGYALTPRGRTELPDGRRPTCA